MAESPAPTSIDEHLSESLQPAPGLEDFLEQNFKKIVIFAAGALLVAAIVGLVSRSNHEALVRAAVDATKAKTAEDCDLVLSKHPGTVAAGNALITKAALQWTANQKDSSVSTLQAFVKDFPNHPFMMETLVALGSRLDSMGKGDEAQKIFQQVRQNYPNTAAAALSQLRTADALTASGKVDEAKKILENFAREFQGKADFIESSDLRLKWISAGLPTKEVDAPPAPKVEAPKDAAAAPAGPAIKLTPGSQGPVVSQPIKVEAPKPVAPAAPAAAPTPSAPVTPASQP